MIILVAVILMFSSSSGPGNRTVPIPDEFHMYCVNCNKEMVFPKKQWQEIMAQTPRDLAMAMRGKCPVCGKNSLIRETQCPACKAWFETDAMKTGRDMIMQGVSPMGVSAQVVTCPKCGVNIQEWLRTHPPKK
jgi:predicted RNA-binding Zn-ribbon protein involved in translation (DUF1610 family)